MKTKKIISMLLIATMLLSVFSVVSFANFESKSEILDDYETYCAYGEASAYMTFEKKHFSLDEPISFVCKTGVADIYIKSYEFEFVNASLISSLNSNGEYSFVVACEEEQNEAICSVFLTLSNDDISQLELYVFKTDYGYFIDTQSLAEAEAQYFEYIHNQGLINKLERDRYISALYSEDVIEEEAFQEGVINTNTRAVYDTYVTVKVRWADRNGTVFPTMGIKVQLYDEDSLNEKLLATGYTDNNGSVTLGFENADRVIDLENGGYDIFIRVYAQDSGSFSVTNSSGSVYCYTTSVLYENIVTGSNKTHTCTFQRGNSLCQAMQITQPIYTCLNYSKAMGVTPEYVTIQYPRGDNKNSCSYYRSSRTIKIAPENNNQTPIYSYESWDTICHEYGHHIQYQVGIIEHVEVEEHFVDYNHIDEFVDTERVNPKLDGVRLAWNESWPTVFGLIAQKYYQSTISGVLYVGDASYTDYQNINYSIESQCTKKGDACEDSIIGILWDAFDSTNENEYDNLSWGYNKWFSVTTNGHKTFSDFINYLIAYYPSDNILISNNLTYYKMAPRIYKSACYYGDTRNNPLEITFDFQGGSTKMPNNCATIIFYDDTMNQIYRTGDIWETSYRLTQSEWNYILSRCTNQFSVIVTGEVGGVPNTGPYYSAPVTFLVPTS